MTTAERQELTREVNQHIRERFNSLDDPMTPLEILCECGGCTALAATTLGDYDRLRADGYLTVH